RIDLLLARRRAVVAEALPGIRVVPFEKTDAFRHPIRFIRLLRRLRGEGYDAVIDAAHWHAFSLTSALLSRIAARRWLIGAERGARRAASGAIGRGRRRGRRPAGARDRPRAAGRAFPARGAGGHQRHGADAPRRRVRREGRRAAPRARGRALDASRSPLRGAG